jgi:15-cis-phytoene synthase
MSTAAPDAAQITRASKSNLALAFVALPRERRGDISTFYAFCRIVDDIADEPGDPVVKQAGLDAWKRAVAEKFDGEPALAAAVREVIAKYALPVAQFREIIAGMEMDLHGAAYATWEDLRLYCHRVASVVGLVSIEIFGCGDPRSREYAGHLGLALQLTNILRDVGQDLANEGRVYLPAEDLARFKVTREDLAAHRRDERFLALMDFETTRARDFYAKARQCISSTDRRALVAAEIMSAIYSRLLDKMQRDRFRVFDRRYALPKWRKIALILRTTVATRMARSGS